MRKTIMLTCCMLLIGLLIPNLLQAQEEPVINFSKSRLTLSGALSAVEQQSGYSIAYNENLLDLKKVVTAPSGKRLSQVLASLLEGTNCEARIKDKIILIVKKEKGAVKVYSGKVQDKDGPVIGAVIQVEGMSAVAMSDNDGSFSIQAQKGDVLLVSMLAESRCHAAGPCARCKCDGGLRHPGWKKPCEYPWYRLPDCRKRTPLCD